MWSKYGEYCVLSLLFSYRKEGLVPYFEVGRIDELVDSSFTNSIGSVTAEGKAFTGGSFERGFRTITPTGAEVKEIALNVAEPYSWFVDLQDMKIRNLAKQGFDTSQLTVDRGHSWYFEQYRQTGLLDASWSRSGTTSYIRNGRPQLSAGGLNSAVATLPSSNLESYAAVQYGRMAPSVGEFSLSTFLGELREGLPRLVPDLLTRAKTAKAAGGDYLNVEFGWKPLLNDCAAWRIPSSKLRWAFSGPSAQLTECAGHVLSRLSLDMTV
jgi:hypothetical protein